MRFDALYFLFFFAIVYGLSKIPRIGPAVYILASFLFYIVAGWQDLALIITMIIFNYGASFYVSRSKIVFSTTVAINLATLLYFKYSSFLGSSLGANEIFNTQIIIPLGISFYVFQMIAYQVDIVRGTCRQITSFPRFYLFVAFFPQLIAGPIVRANDISNQINRLFKKGQRNNTIISLGLGLCLLGLVKKVILSDSLAPIVDTNFSIMPDTALAAWQGILTFTFQIYYDFSGYSDIALGLGYLLGIRLPINFKQPYLAKSPQEFWQRWHITLSQWVRDYLYIPLGGNKIKGPIKQLTALILVMTLMGLWHGANWTFAAWGASWGVAILLWRIGAPFFNKRPLVSWLGTLLVTVILWVFFRAPNMGFALDYLQIMFTPSTLNMNNLSWIWSGMIVLGGLHLLEGRYYNLKGIKLMKKINQPFCWGILIGLCFTILLLPKALDNPFIYFRF